MTGRETLSSTGIERRQILISDAPEEPHHLPDLQLIDQSEDLFATSIPSPPAITSRGRCSVVRSELVEGPQQQLQVLARLESSRHRAGTGRPIRAAAAPPRTPTPTSGLILLRAAPDHPDQVFSDIEMLDDFTLRPLARRNDLASPA
jgi:hypothetical protein